jgi:Tol biopolymer transport system component
MLKWCRTLAHGVRGTLPLPQSRSESSQRSRLAVGRRNGGAAKQLLECADPCFVNESPAYSPDGRKVAFVQMLGQGGTHPDDCGLWILDRATGKSRRLTRHATCQDREAYPRWSPDGSKLVFFREHYGANDATERTAVFTVSAQGGKARQLTPWEMIAGHPDWSPDGKLIVFSTYPLGFFPEATVSHIYTMRPDGTNRRQLTDYSSAEGRASHPRWLPDGTGIVYVLGQKGHRELWRMAPDGTERLRIKATGDSWHPRLAAASARVICDRTFAAGFAYLRVREDGSPADRPLWR